MSISFSKIAVLAVLSSAVALTTGCATKRSTSEVVVAPLGIPGGQVGYNGAVIVDNSNAVITGAENLQAVVYFAFDSSEITAQAASVLNQHVSLLNSNPAAGVVIAGHISEQNNSVDRVAELLTPLAEQQKLKIIYATQTQGFGWTTSESSGDVSRVA